MTDDDAREFARVQNATYERAGASIRGSWPPEQAMDAGAMAAFLDAKHYCVLATARPNGYPQARPVGFTVFDSSFWIATVGGQRLENLRTTPYASLVVMEGEHGDHRMVLAEGSVVVQYAMPDALEGAWIERHGRSPDWAVAFIGLSPERVFSYDAKM